MEQFQKLWQQIKSELKEKYNEETYLDTFENLNEIAKFEHNHVFVIAPDAFLISKIKRVYIQQINQYAQRIYGDKIMFDFILREDLTKNSTQETIDIIKNQPGYENTSLNANYTFDNFIVGKSNNYAYRVAEKVASQPGVVHNPLYIFGDVGLGKTHLMQAIGNYAIYEKLDVRILYAKANEFIEEYKYYLDNKNMMAFNTKYRNIDMLLMDDIQMLSKATQSQAEFFKIFDRLKNENKQIVITCDRPPKELNDVASRITTRFEEGLIIDINVPDLDHRIDILKYELKTQYQPDIAEQVPVDCIKYIANNFKTNIRELKGALRRAMSYCEINSLNYNLHYFQEAVAPLISTKKKTDALSENNYDKILSIVSSTYSITIDALIGEGRAYKVATPRHIAMYLIKHLYNIPYKKIGEIFSNRDHSTVLMACNKIEKDLKTDRELQIAVGNIIKKIQC